MPLRFTEADKWKQEWFQEFNTWQKIMYYFLYDNCDAAGFIEVNPKYNAFLLDMDQENFTSVLDSVECLYHRSTDGKLLCLKNFLVDQKNWPLKLANPAHKKIQAMLDNNIDRFEASIP